MIFLFLSETDHTVQNTTSQTWLSADIHWKRLIRTHYSPEAELLKLIQPLSLARHPGMGLIFANEKARRQFPEAAAESANTGFNTTLLLVHPPLCLSFQPPFLFTSSITSRKSTPSSMSLATVGTPSFVHPLRLYTASRRNSY